MSVNLPYVQIGSLKLSSTTNVALATSLRNKRIYPSATYGSTSFDRMDEAHLTNVLNKLRRERNQFNQLSATKIPPPSQLMELEAWIGEIERYFDELRGLGGDTLDKMDIRDLIGQRVVGDHTGMTGVVIGPDHRHPESFVLDTDGSDYDQDFCYKSCLLGSFRLHTELYVVYDGLHNSLIMNDGRPFSSIAAARRYLPDLVEGDKPDRFTIRELTKIEETR